MGVDTVLIALEAERAADLDWNEFLEDYDAEWDGPESMILDKTAPVLHCLITGADLNDGNPPLCFLERGGTEVECEWGDPPRLLTVDEADAFRKAVAELEWDTLLKHADCRLAAGYDSLWTEDPSGAKDLYSEELARLRRFLDQAAGKTITIWHRA